MKIHRNMCCILAAFIAVPITAKADTLVVDPTGSTGSYTTISTAITDSRDGDEIVIVPGTYYENLDIDETKRTLYLKSQDPNKQVIVDAGGSGRVLNDNSTSVFTNMDFTNGKTMDYGAGCKTRKGTFENCRFYNNQVGGGASVVGDATFQNCQFYDNKSIYRGGGCRVQWETEPTFVGCEFYRNESDEYGGGVDIHHTSFPQFEDCEFNSNKAAKRGGACSIMHDTWGVSGRMSFERCHFENNSSTDCGGALYSESSHLQVLDSHLENNKSHQGAGIALSHEANLYVRKTSVFENTAGYGGAIDLQSVGGFSLGNIQFHDVEFKGNSARFGGTIHSNGATCYLYDCQLNNGQASNQGGHLYALSSRFEVEDSQFESGDAKSVGGMLLLLKSTYKCKSNAYTSGKANGGAMLWASESDILVDGSTFQEISSDVDPQYESGVSNGRAVYTQKTTARFQKTLFQNFASSDYLALSMFEHRDSYVIYESSHLIECSMKSPISAFSSGAMYTRPTILHSDDGHLEMYDCLVSNNKSGMTGHILKNSDGKMTIDSCDLMNNGERGLGRIPRGSTRKKSMNGVVRHESGNVQVMNSFFCGNKISNYSGGVTDLGGNSTSLRCP